MLRESEQLFSQRHSDDQLVHEKMLNFTEYQVNANQSHIEISLHS